MSANPGSPPTAGDRPAKPPRRRSLLVWAIEGIRWRLARRGLRIYPYVAVLEGAEPISVPALPPSLRADWVTEDHIDLLDILWSGHDGTTREKMRERFRAGNRCFALWDGDQIPAATWCDFDLINHEPEQRTLAHHEVYLFDAYVSPAARGRNLAPLLRHACYDACRALGRTTMHSFTDYFNESSHRFKAKLGAKKLSVRVQVVLFGRWSRTFTLWRYRS